MGRAAGAGAGRASGGAGMGCGRVGGCGRCRPGQALARGPSSGVVVGRRGGPTGACPELLVHGRDQFRAARVAVLLDFGHGPGDDRVHCHRQAGEPAGDRRRRIAKVGEDHLDVVLALEGHRAGEAVEQDAAERVDVGPSIDLPALDLLGGHVRDRADELVGGGERRERLLGAHLLDEPEVAQITVAARARRGRGEKDVGRLDVAVDQPAGVGGVQRAGHLGHDGHGPRPAPGGPPAPARSARSEPST